jgi:CheY-like chemotaxis protein
MEEKVILLVEDDADVEALALRAFAKFNAADQVVVARDGPEALDFLFGTGIYVGRDVKLLPRVVLLDLHLPKMDGFEVLRRIRLDARTKMLPIVVLTSSDDPKDIALCYDLGANSYVRKPVDFAEFVETMRQLALYWLVVNTSPTKAAKF